MNDPHSQRFRGSALLTDLYQLTMAYGYWKTKTHEKDAIFHLFFRKAPFQSGYTLAAGLADAIAYLRGLRFTDDDLAYLASLVGNDDKALFEPAFLTHLRDFTFTCDVDAIPEGTAVFPNEPLIRVSGPIIQGQLIETALLNFINFQSLIATKAARICQATQGEPVLEFGLRRAQGIDGALAASRAAYIGGCTATSNLLAGQIFGIPVKGTHAHSWVMSFDDELESFRAYAAAMPNNCVFLVDTYDTVEGVRHAVEVGRWLKSQGREMVGIRLDSGDLAYLSIQARKILDEGGFPQAVIIASNDLDEHIITSLKQQGAKIGFWGVGTKLVTAFDQPALGGVYKLAAIRERGAKEWIYKLKLSEQAIKVSTPGILQVRRFLRGGEYVADMIFNEEMNPGNSRTIVDPADLTRRKSVGADATAEDLLVPIFRGGKLVYREPALTAIRAHVQVQLKHLYGGTKRLLHPHEYPVGLEPKLHELKNPAHTQESRPNLDRSSEPMNLIKVAAAVLNQTPLDWEGNQKNILAAIAEARAQGVSVLCLPELCVTGYGCEDAFHAAFVHRTAWARLQAIAPATKGLIVSLGLPIFNRNGLFNTAALLVDGKIAGFVAKRFLAGDGIHYEPRWFKPWPAGLRQDLVVDGQTHPFGDLFFDLGGVRLGFEICEDAWVANRPGAALALRGVDLILNPSASHFAFGKNEVRKRFVLEGSRAFGSTYIYTNLLGNEAGRAIYDGGALIASSGHLLAAGPRFSFRDWVLTTAVVDLDATRMNQARTASYQPNLQPTEGDGVNLPFVIPQTAFEPSKVSLAAWETGLHVKEEEFARTEALGLFDYLRKSRSEGCVVSLSGGADSSAVSVLVGLVVQLGARELGLDGLRAKLTHVKGIAAIRDERELIRRLLVCVYQGTRNSTSTTRQAAQVVADAVGAEFLEFEVDQLVEDYTTMIAKAMGRPLDWGQDDLALQNIQARVRAPGVWFLANLRNALLLATSNRSEAAVGYATMDGDTSGGLSPIAGIDKAYLRRWLVWMEQSGPLGIGPLPALKAVNVQPPTAELRPVERKQTDEDDLMPYTLLDACERAAIRDKKSPAEVLTIISHQFPEYEAEQLRLWVTRFFRLWSRNQWKRERYAPSFHLDDENLDPKTWCRFPILSAGFASELAALNAPTSQPPA